MGWFLTGLKADAASEGSSIWINVLCRCPSRSEQPFWGSPTSKHACETCFYRQPCSTGNCVFWYLKVIAVLAFLPPTKRMKNLNSKSVQPEMGIEKSNVTPNSRPRDRSKEKKGWRRPSPPPARAVGYQGTVTNSMLAKDGMLTTFEVTATSMRSEPASSLLVTSLERTALYWPSPAGSAVPV